MYFFFLNCISCSAQVEDVYPMFPCSKKLSEPYGVCAHFTQSSWDRPYQESLLKTIKELQITNVRYDLWVPYVENLYENIHLAHIRDAVKINKNSNINQLGVLFVGWKGQRAWQRKEKYLEFLDSMLTQYKYTIPYWEVMNEVNQAAFSDKIPLDSAINSYLPLLSLTHQKIKKTNSKLKVTSSGLGEIDDTFLELLSKKGAYRYFDILNFHTYCAPELLPIKIEKIRKLMDEYHWEKPVWITECGYSTYDEKNVSKSAEGVNQKEQEQANRIPRLYLIAFSYGVNKVFTYSLRSREGNPYEPEDHFGILHSDLSPKPAYYAYNTLTKMCPNKSVRPKLRRKGNVYIAQWERPDGKKVYGLWTSKNNKEITVEVKGEYSCYDIGGEIIVQRSDKVIVSPSILYFVGDKKLDLRIVE